MDTINDMDMDATFLEDCKKLFHFLDNYLEEVSKAPECYMLCQEFYAKYKDYINGYEATYAHIQDDESLLNINSDSSHNMTKESELICEIYYRLGFASYTIVHYNNLVKSSNEPKSHEPGYNFVKKSLQYSPNNKKALYYYAIISGILAEQSPYAKQRIQLGKHFYASILKLLVCDPDNSLVYHLLARFQLNLLKLNWLERKIAGAVFGNIFSEISYEGIEANLLKAEELKPNWPSNHLYLAKCFITQKRIDEASKWVNLGLEYKPDHPTTQMDLNELKELKRKYKF